MPNSVMYGLPIKVLRLPDFILDSIWDRYHPDPEAMYGPSMLQVSTSDIIGVVTTSMLHVTTDLQSTILKQDPVAFQMWSEAMGQLLNASGRLIDPIYRGANWIIDGSAE